MESRLPRWVPGATLSLLRFVTAMMFMQHGAQKLFGFLAAPERPFTGAPPMFSLYWIAGVLELFGGAFVLLGLFTRPVAFLLCGEMAVAYFKVHAARGFWPLANRGEVVVLFCFIFLFLAANGGGPWSLDALRRGGARRATEAPGSGVV